LFEIMQLPVGDINAQNQRMKNGENSEQDIAKHTDAWIKGHQKTFDSWIQQALAAANK
ncbi:MAG: proline/glycine betaine ABC transporter substrate-binding protein ProX, partial [Polaromonas sp.]